MLNTLGITTTIAHAASTHLLPGTIVIAGTFLIFRIAGRKSQQRRHDRTQREEFEQKQAELEQKLEDMQSQYDSLKQTQDLSEQEPEPAKVAYTPTFASGKQTLFETIINENIAIREAANA